MSEDIHIFNKTNVIIWGAILVGIIVISAVVFIFDQFQTFKPMPEAQNVNQILFIIAVISAFGILILKRSIFLPDKIIANIIKKSNGQKNHTILIRIRRNYIIIWSLAELIVLIGFINYIFAVNFQTYLIFAIVGIYSILINFPRQKLAEQCLEQLAEFNE